jgi:hypothetical protein
MSVSTGTPKPLADLRQDFKPLVGTWAAEGFSRAALALSKLFKMGKRIERKRSIKGISKNAGLP